MAKKGKKQSKAKSKFTLKKLVAKVTKQPLLLLGALLGGYYLWKGALPVIGQPVLTQGPERMARDPLGVRP